MELVSILENAKRHNSVINAGGVTDFVLSTLFDDALYFDKIEYLIQ